MYGCVHVFMYTGKIIECMYDKNHYTYINPDFPDQGRGPGNKTNKLYSYYYNITITTTTTTSSTTTTSTSTH